MSKKIALAGVPNCGKSSFFNSVTGANAKVGNWPGVTSAPLAAQIKACPGFELIDLPGAYSLSGGGLDENAALAFLKSGEAGGIIIIIDGTNPEQGLYFALELLELGVPAVLGINFADELRAQNAKVSTAALEKELGVPVFLISAKTGENVNLLLSAAIAAKPPLPKAKGRLSPESRRSEAAGLAAKCFRFGKREEKSSSGIYFSSAAVLALICVLGFCGNMLKEGIALLFEYCSAFLGAAMNYIKLPQIISSFIIEGLLAGIETVIGFLPELFFIFTVLAFLESSGHIARFAFGCDWIFKKMGLTGRSVIPLLLGFGCTVSAVYAAKASESEDFAKRTLSALMFIPCSARLPLSLLICKTVFGEYGDIMLIIVYCFVILLGASICFLQSKKQTVGNFIMELPTLRLPSTKAVLKISFRRLNAFIKKAGIILVLTAAVLWVLKSFSFDLRPVSLQSESALSAIGAFFAPAFKIIGIPTEGVAPLLCGIFAKEAALFALSAAGNAQALFAPISACSFLIFYLLYTPCLGCLASIKQEFGLKKAIWLSIRQIAIAYFAAFIFYTAARLIIR